MRPTTRQIFKRCLLAVLVALAGLLTMSGLAHAAVTNAPVITATPPDPNTTHGEAEFTFEMDPEEGSSASVLRFYCRQYPTATPPAPADGWTYCARTSDDPPYSTAYTPPNGPQTFEVALRESGSISTQGPIASFEWVQDIAVPAQPPALVTQPDDPTTTVPSLFEYEPGAGEENLVTRYECTIDGGGWESCSYRNMSALTLENGEHTFQVRAGNQLGFGPPIPEFTWTVAVPNPEPAVDLDDVATARWDGRTPEMYLGRTMTPSRSGLTSVGDINGDGKREIMIDSQDPSDYGMYILFGGVQKGARALADISPDVGYRLVRPGGGLAYGGYSDVGDQNGDGIPDVAFKGEPSNPFSGDGSTVFVVYGVADPSTLPLCPNSAVTRCVNVDDLAPTEGYALNLPGYGTIRSFNSAGDFNGDGVVDLIMDDRNGNGAYIVKGGARSGTVAVDALAADQALRINGTDASAGYGFGTEGTSPLGDINGDGKDDVYISVFGIGGGYILYGNAWTSSPFEMSEFTNADGLRVFAAALSVSNVTNIGDVNKDGRPDLAATTLENTISFPEEGQMISVIYGPEQPSPEPIVIGPDMDEGDGYLITRGGLPANLGATTLNAGDLNNDGLSDALASASGTAVDGLPDAGAAYLLFGQDPGPADPFGVGPELTPDMGVAMLGDDLDSAGETVAPLGDIDGDGLSDFAVSAPYADHNGLQGSGSIYIVPGKALINQVKTGKAAGVGNTSAVLNAGVSTNDRDSEVWFEYGTTSDYGSSTDPESFEGSNTGDGASAAIDGLAKNTEYHYRAVAKNALGLVRYGDDRTFTTANDANPGGDPCAADSTKPGCADYCTANPTAKGCDGYDWCGNNPGKCSTGKSKARLALIATQKRVAVKRGRKGVVRVAVVNTGGKVAKGVKVCVKAPKRLVKVKRCVKVGKLGSGKTRVVKVKVKAKRKRGKAVLKLTANGKGVGKKKARARVVVR